MAIQPLTKAAIHHSCGDRIDQRPIKEAIDPFGIKWSKGSLNDLLRHQKEAHTNRQMAACSLAELGMDPPSEAH